MTNQRGFALITLLVPLFAVLTGAAANAATMTSVTINTPNAQVTDPSAATLANDGNGYVATGADVEILCGLICFPNFVGNGQASASVGILRAGVESTGSVDLPGWTAQAFFRDDFTLGGLSLGTVVSIGANLENTGFLEVVQSGDPSSPFLTFASAEGGIAVTQPCAVSPFGCIVAFASFNTTAGSAGITTIRQQASTGQFSVTSGVPFSLTAHIFVTARGRTLDPLTQLGASADLAGTALLTFDLPPGTFITSPGGFSQSATAFQVTIDIKPGSFPNSINRRSKGKIPVAILSTADFDAPARVDWASLTFGRTGDERSLAFCDSSPEDVNGDGLPDLVCHFSTQLTGFDAGDTEGVVKGRNIDGTAITGRDSVRIVP